MMSFGWAMTLFTADHLGGLLAPGGAGRAAAGLAAVAAAAEARLGARERALLYLGNGLERELAGRAGDLCAGWQELSDKLEAFGGFDGARSSAVFSGVAGLAGARAAAPLLAALERAAARGLYPSLWEVGTPGPAVVILD